MNYKHTAMRLIPSIVTRKLPLILFCMLAFASCDILLPKPMSYEDTDEDDSHVESSYNDNYSANGDCYENDGLNLFVEHDLGVMFVYSFYHEWCFGNGRTDPTRYFSKRLKRLFDEIDELETSTGYLTLDWDPFIDAQDIVFGENDFTIERSDDYNWFIFKQGNKRVHLHLIEENNKYYIDDVLLSTGETLTEFVQKQHEEALNTL